MMNCLLQHGPSLGCNVHIELFEGSVKVVYLRILFLKLISNNNYNENYIF